MYNYTFDDYLARQRIDCEKYWVDESKFKFIYGHIISFYSELLPSQTSLILSNICEYAMRFNVLSDKQYFVIEQIANHLGLTFSNTVELGVLCKEA